MERVAVYVGSFDPPTNGHYWMIEQGAKLFDRLIVGIGTNPKKHYMFSERERLDMVRAIAAEIPNVDINAFPNQFTVDFARSMNASFIVRGIRSASDYEAEHRDLVFNNRFDQKITTWFLMPPVDIELISSSSVKAMTIYRGWERKVAPFVSPLVLQKLKEKSRGKHS